MSKKSKRPTCAELLQRAERQLMNERKDTEIRLLQERNDAARHHAKVLETIATNLSKQSRIYQTNGASYEEYQDL